MEKFTMKDYVYEVPQMMRSNIACSDNLVRPLIDYIGDKTVNKITLVASGSSYNACYCAQPFMEKYLGIDVKIVAPFTFANYGYDVTEDNLVLVVTQSGLSTNAIEALKKLREIHHDAVCLTGNPNNDVKDYADLVIDYGVGEELVGYVTKGVTALCLFLMLFACLYGNKRDVIEDIKKTVDLNEKMIHETENFLVKHYKHFTSMTQCYFCASQSNYGTALEGALKIGETVHIPTGAYETEEYIHGPNLQLTPLYNVIIFDNNDHTSVRNHQIYLGTREVTDHCFMISSNPAYAEDEQVLYLEMDIKSELLPLVYLPFVQLTSYIVSTDLKSIFQHPLMKKFKKIADAKTANFVNYDGDD